MDINNRSPRRFDSRHVGIDGFSGARPVKRPAIRLDRALRYRKPTAAPLPVEAPVAVAEPASVGEPAQQPTPVEPVTQVVRPSNDRVYNRRWRHGQGGAEVGRATLTGPIEQPKAVSLDMSLPGSDSAEHRHPVFKTRFSVVRHWAFRASMAALILILLTGGLLFTQGYFSAQKVFKGGAHAAALQPKVDPNLLKGEGDGRINILLLGNGGPGHDGADLTDTMIVASIDPVNHTAVLLSIPRDLWVEVPGHGSMKINAAYAMGKYDFIGKVDTSNNNSSAVLAGFKSVDQVVESTLGIDIHYNYLVNFPAFKEAVDAVGGIIVDVPEALYDQSMAWENNNNPLLAAAGTQNFDGKQALLYVRSRHSSSDFARSERQRSVLMALKTKAVSLGTLSNPLKISQLMSAFGNNMITDLSLSDANRLYEIGKGIQGSDVKSISFVDKDNMLVKTGGVGNQSVVLPLAGMYNYDNIRMFVRKSLPDGFILKENASISVLNGTSVSGRATAEGDDLKTYGYNVTSVGNAPTKDYKGTRLIDLTDGRDKYTRNYLEQRFGVKATNQVPGTIQPGQSDFILILGTDETTSQ